MKERMQKNDQHEIFRKNNKAEEEDSSQDINFSG